MIFIFYLGIMYSGDADVSTVSVLLWVYTHTRQAKQYVWPRAETNPRHLESFSNRATRSEWVRVEYVIFPDWV